MKTYILDDDAPILAINDFDIIHATPKTGCENMFQLYPDNEALDALSRYINGEEEWESSGKINYFLLNSLSNVNPCNLTYLAVVVYANEKTAVLVEADMPGNSKLWINGELGLIVLEEQKKEFISAVLHKGLNTILILFNQCEELLLPPYIYLQVYKKQLLVDKLLLKDMQRDFTEQSCVVSAQYCKNYVEFMLFPVSNTESEIFLPLFINGRPIDNGEGNYYRVKKVYKIFLTEDEENKCIIYTVNPFRIVYCHVDSDYLNRIVSKVLTSLSDISEDQKTDIAGELHQLQGRLATRVEQYVMLCNIENHRLPEDMLRAFGHVKLIHYLSVIDNSVQELRVVLPKQPCPEEGYPVIFVLSIDWYDSLLEYQGEHCIIANISGRGVLGGGYINECAYMEGIEVLYSHYSIDMKRIYFVGKSNGGYAAWTLSQCYPDLAASIIPISGYPILNMLENIHNVGIYNIISNMDTCYTGEKHKEIEQRLLANKNYKFENVPNMLHHALSDYRWIDLEKFFLSYQRQEYPEKVVFVTERGCYLKSYWVQLHGICQGHRYAKVCAQKVKSNEYEIETEGASGITISLPQDQDEKTWILKINGKQFIVNNPNSKELHFGISESEILPVDEPRKNDYIKGMGILGIYRNPLRILIPEQADDYEMLAARSFSTPHSNGYYDWIDINYPVLRLREASSIDLQCSLVFINLPKDQIEDLLGCSVSTHITVLDNGFQYLGKFYEGNYCIMQVIEHPLSTGKSILLINANDTSLLRRNMFTRKVVIPFYHDGSHPAWNSAVLIYWNKQYLKCYEWGDEPTEI